MQSTEGFYEDGVVVTDRCRTLRQYLGHSGIVICLDVGSVLPIDVLAFWYQLQVPVYRLNRLLKCHRAAVIRTRLTAVCNHPNLLHFWLSIANICILVHWNACLYFLLSRYLGLSSNSWVYDDKHGRMNSMKNSYLYSLIWSTMVLTNIGETARAVRTHELTFMVVDFFASLLIFATMVGNTGNYIAEIGNIKTTFQTKAHTFQSFMERHQLPVELRVRVSKWFNYSWLHRDVLLSSLINFTFNENGVTGQTKASAAVNLRQLYAEHTPLEDITSVLSPFLRTDLCVQSQMESLKRVPIFAGSEFGFLTDLVTKLRPVLYGPGDYICETGEIGRHMYIIRRGRLVVEEAATGKILVSLGPGAVFGEISLIEIPGSPSGNRRTADIRSVGFSEILVLHKSHLIEALDRFPAAKSLLVEKGSSILRKDNLLHSEKIRELKSSQKREESHVKQLIQAVNAVELRYARIVGEHKAALVSLKRRLDAFKRYRQSSAFDV